ncbi:Acetyl esterase [Clostridiales bacterium CHKCI001]|nr:Acetyl esterase [Clostridiales bacterium CHKCI001]
MRFRELPKKWKTKIITLSFISFLFFALLVIFNMFLSSYRAENERQRAKLVKDNRELIGERIEIPRNGKVSIKANLYVPDTIGDEPLPVVFNIHGGGFVGGDADVLDTQSDRIASEWNVVVVTINYTKADVKPVSYGCEEIRDVVLYFADQAETYGIDPSKFTLIGYSAGAYYAADSTRLLQKSDFDMASLVLCYPWTTGLNADKLEKDFPPTLFVLSGQDPISQKAKNYVKDMESEGLKPEVIEYENAVHSFIESNNPEGMIEDSADMSDVINSEQESLAREAEAAISEWIRLR